MCIPIRVNLQQQPPEVFLKISQNSQENTCARASFLMSWNFFKWNQVTGHLWGTAFTKFWWHSDQKLIRNIFRPILKVWHICTCNICDYSLVDNIYKFPNMVPRGNLHWGHPFIYGIYRWHYKYGDMNLEILSCVSLFTWNVNFHTNYEVGILR